nr:integrase, catalytic region, zinc finger, CCHC-type, peptidase aspartic, catalytic [Tanacetum cinerariifolium]
MACDVPWKSKLSTLNEENVLLKTQVDSVVKERESIELDYQKLFNSIKVTRTQHQKELDELIKHVNQKAYAYADVRAKNQDLLIAISKLKNKLKTIDKGKNVNTKFGKSETSVHFSKLSTLPSAFVLCDTGTIRFENDHFAAIIGYGDYVQGNRTICHVYYVEGLGHNLFLIGQFYDGDLEVAFW